MINTTDFEELARRITGQINSIRTLKTDILLKHIQFGTSVNRDKSLEDMEKHLDKMLDHVELDFVKLYRYVGLLTSTIEKSQLCDLGDEDLERLSALQEDVELLDI